MKKTMLMLAVVGTSLCASAQNSREFQNVQAFQKSQTITIDDYARQLLEAPNAQVLDVRSPEEYAINHIKGAISINFADSAATAAIVEKLDPAAPTFTYSIREGRSVFLARQLKEKGFKTVYFMPGGIGTWVGAGYPLESSVDPSKAVDIEKYNQLVAANHLTFVDISSIHCGSCKKFHPVLDELEKEYPNVKILRFEMDENLQLVKDLKVQVLPTFYLYRDGQLIKEVTGSQTKEGVEKLFNDALQNNL